MTEIYVTGLLKAMQQLANFMALILKYLYHIQLNKCTVHITFSKFLYPSFGNNVDPDQLASDEDN